MGLTASNAASSEAAKAALNERTQRLQRMAFAVLANAETIRAMKSAIANGDLFYVAQLWLELDQAEHMALNVAPSKGGIWTTAERAAIREAEVEHAPEIRRHA